MKSTTKRGEHADITKLCRIEAKSKNISRKWCVDYLLASILPQVKALIEQARQGSNSMRSLLINELFGANKRLPTNKNTERLNDRADIFILSQIFFDLTAPSKD